MPPSGREIKTKSTKPKRRQQQTVADADVDTHLVVSNKPKAKKGGKHKHSKHYDDRGDESCRVLEGHASIHSSSSPSQRSNPGTANAHSISEHLFVTWDELLASHQELKMKLDSVVAVHGWQRRSSRKNFLGGFEPAALLQSIREEIAAIKPASEALEKADLLLELQGKHTALRVLKEERDSLMENVYQLREDCFEAQDQLAAQSTELDELRQLVVQHDITAGIGQKSSEGKCNIKDSATGGQALSKQSPSSNLAIFQNVLSRSQLAEGKTVVGVLESLKLPDESVMDPQQLACWHENKKTIVNSLKTLSGQIYSATTRILFEIIQNADDCTFEEGVRPELLFESSEEALVAWHNESGFQPKDLYAMCQVSETSRRRSLII